MYSEHGQGNIDCSNNDVRYLMTFGKSLVVKDHEWFSMKHWSVINYITIRYWFDMDAH